MSKFLIGFSAFFLLLLGGGVYFYTSSLLDTDELKLNIVREIEKQLPFAEVETGDFNLFIGPVIELSGGEFLLKNKEAYGGEELLSADSFIIKIPLFSILLGGGNIEVSVESPHFVQAINKRNKKSNWLIAKEGLEHNSKRKILKSKKSGGLSEGREFYVPLFLAHSTLAFRFNDMKLIYKNAFEKSYNIHLDKVIVKNLGVNSNAAFEVNSDFSITHDEKSQFDVKGMIFGSFALKDYIRTGELSSEMTIQLVEPTLSSLGVTLPLLRGDVKARLDRQGESHFDVKINQERSHFFFKTLVTQKGIFVKDMDGDIQLGDTLSLWKILLPSLELTRTHLKLKGKFDLLENQIIPAFSVSMDNIYVSDFIDSGKGKALAEFRDKEASFEAVSPFLSGTVSKKVNLKYDLSHKLTIDEKIKDFQGSVLLTGLHFKKNDLKKIKKMILENKKIFQVIGASLGGILLPKGALKIEMVNNDWEGMPLSGVFNVDVRKRKVILKDFNLKSKEGFADLKGKVSFYKDRYDFNMDFSLQHFPSHYINLLLPEKSRTIEGFVSGKLKAKFQGKKELRGKGHFHFESEKGQWKNIDVEEKIEELHERLKDVPLLSEGLLDIEKGKKSKAPRGGEEDKVSKNDRGFEGANAYKFIKIRGRFDQDFIQIKKMDYSDEGGHFLAHGKGKIYWKNKGSVLYMDAVDDYGVVKALDKYLGIRKIPLLLKGERFSLKEDLNYTVDKLSRSIAKGKGKKALQNLIKKSTKKNAKKEGRKKE